jgi:predicted nucleic acid-binding protein
MKNSGSIIVDSYAWVEYLRGTKKGEKVKSLLNKRNNDFITIECCIAELKGWSLKNEINFDKVFRVIKSNSRIIPVLIKDWVKAAEIRFEMRKKIKDFGLIDSILVAKQKELNCLVLSGDKHFRNLKDVEFIS